MVKQVPNKHLEDNVFATSIDLNPISGLFIFFLLIGLGIIVRQAFGKKA